MDLNGNVLFVNKAACKILGYPEHELIGKDMHKMVHYAYSDSKPYPKEKCPVYASITKGTTVQVDDEVLWSKNKEAISVRYTSTPIFENDKIVGVVVTFLDMMGEKKAKQELVQQAHYDKLTHLPNRNSFFLKLQSAISLAQRNDEYFSVMFIDLDNFKNINDTKGHAFGDLVLAQLAKKIQSAIRVNDYIARIGGDEFSAIFERVKKPELVARVAKNILAKLRKPLLVHGQPLQVTVSIGISTYPIVGREANALLKTADIAMYRAKELGKNTFVFYTSKLNEKVKRIQAIESSLISAIRNNELSLYYQPIVDVISKKVLEVEVLVRWNNKALCNPSPDEFIAVAEQSYIIDELSEWIIHQSLKHLKILHKYPRFNQVKLTINLSAKHLSTLSFFHRVDDILTKSLIDPASLVFEVTETAIMADIKRSSQILEKISDRGIKIALDDFGTGYSSMLYLKKLPITYLKIDKEFIQDVLNDPNDNAIVKAIITLAKTLDLISIAEGVESQEQLDFLSENGCEMFQGFLFSKPLPLAKLLTFDKLK